MCVASLHDTSWPEWEVVDQLYILHCFSAHQSQSNSKLEAVGSCLNTPTVIFRQGIYEPSFFFHELESTTAEATPLNSM